MVQTDGINKCRSILSPEFIACLETKITYNTYYILPTDRIKICIIFTIFNVGRSTTGVNPGIRLYTFSDEDGSLMDYQQYYLDLDKLNFTSPQLK